MESICKIKVLKKETYVIIAVIIEYAWAGLYKDDSDYFLIFILQAVRGVKGQKIAQNKK